LPSRQKNLTLEELARRTEGQVSARHLRRIETGKSSTTYETYCFIRQGLGVSSVEMFLPYISEEYQIPIFFGRPLSKADLFAVKFQPGETVTKYQAHDDPELYAILLLGNFGLIGEGSLLHVSPRSPLEEGCLVWGVRRDGTARIFRWEVTAEKNCTVGYQFVHRILLILPK
jgi:transcriptional regulator with XRE-family HTH domain